MTDLNTKLGRTLAEARRKAGLSQEGLAFECQLHPTYISQLERGLKSPTVRVLFRIAGALGVRASQIISKIEGKRGKPD